MEKCVAIVLSAGRGKRMNSEIPKQYLPLRGKPILYYSLKAFEDSFVDEIILVASDCDIEFCRTEIVKKYRLKKVSQIVPGGAERYHSVYQGLKAVGSADYVFIHDGARPMLDQAILQRGYRCVKMYKAAVAGMPVKDTIKLADEEQFICSTPRRDRLYQIQTPQVFEFDLIMQAYKELMEKEAQPGEQGIVITDDAMIVEMITRRPVKIYEGDYRNLKITTPEDILFAEAYFSYDLKS